MGVYDRNGIYYYCFKLKGQKQVHRSTRIRVTGLARDKRRADGKYQAALKAAEDKKERKVRKDPALITVRQLLDWYLRIYGNGLDSPEVALIGVKMINQVLGTWGSDGTEEASQKECAFGDLIAPHVTKEDIVLLRTKLVEAGGRNGRQLKQNTVNRYLVPLSAAYEQAKQSKSLNFVDNPILAVKRFNETKFRRKRLPTEPEIDAMWNAFSPLMKRVLMLELTTGLRRGELIEWKWSDIDFERRITKCVNEKNEDKPEKIIGLHKDAIEILSEIPRQGEYVLMYRGHKLKKRGKLHTEWKRVTKKVLKIPNIRFNDLRHGFASYLIMDSRNLKATSLMMGHSRSKTTEDNYLHLLSDHLVDTVDQMRSHLSRVRKVSQKKYCSFIAVNLPPKLFSSN